MKNKGNKKKKIEQDQQKDYEDIDSSELSSDSMISESEQDEPKNQNKDSQPKNFQDNEDGDDDDSDDNDDDQGNQEKNQPEQKKSKQELAQEAKNRDKKDIGYDHYLQAEQEVQDQAPLVVVVQGPPKCGKTTLIQSLVKHYSKHKLKSVVGPITLRASKAARVTFIECPNDINAMIDVSKIADLALIMIDASIGLEMETFEFLSLLRVHGFPNVMGILTHMDFFKDNKHLRKTRQKYKKRFEFQVGSDYKLFYLSGLQGDLYPNRDILNLARYISIIKYGTVPWKLNHPFMMIDRFDHQREGERFDDEDEITVSFYGYIRGSSYRTNSNIHIIGLGDYSIEKIEKLQDPCPPYQKPQKDEQKQKNQNGSGDNAHAQEFETGKFREEEENKMFGENDQGGEKETEVKKSQKKRTLQENQRIIYAPHSNLGFLNYEKSGGYITIPDDYVVFTKQKQNNLIMDDEDGEGAGENEQSEEAIDEGVKMVRDLQDIEFNLNQRLKDDDVGLLGEIQLNDQKPEEKQQNNYSSFDNEPFSKLSVTEKASKDLSQKTRQIGSLIRKTHNFSELTQKFQNQDQITGTDLSQFIYGSNNPISEYDCSQFDHKELFAPETYKLEAKKLFMAGSGYAEQDLENEDEEDSDEETDKKGKNQNRKNDQKDKQEEKQIERVEVNQIIEDELVESQLGIYKRGTYCKFIVKNVKYKHYQNLNPSIPLVLCRINPGEDNFGFLKVRIKKHRWYNTQLKTNDPLIFSIGWRRYQSIPVYCVQDQNDRLRQIKYTPLYDFCLGVFYGNFAPQNTGIICFQTIQNKLEKFRISATGSVLELRHSFDVLKKLKLIGEPYKIYKNTAFIQGMFNSVLEVAKFQGAQIRSVSGIRGQIKKAVREGREGGYRATFEDQLQLSDLVFLKTWFKVPLNKFYNPVISYDRMRLVRTTWELKRDLQILPKDNVDSQYKEIERLPRKYTPLLIPKNVEKSLPFKSQEKVVVSRKQKILEKENNLPIKSLLTDDEKKAFALIQRLNTIKREKTKLKDEKDAFKQKIQNAHELGLQKKFESAHQDYEKSKYKQKFKPNNHDSKNHDDD